MGTGGDAVFLRFTLELFPLPVIPEVLGEICRVLKPGGRCGVVCMHHAAEGEKKSAIEHAYHWMHRHFPHIVDCQPIPEDALLKAAGLEIRKEQHMDIWELPVAAVLAVS